MKFNRKFFVLLFLILVNCNLSALANLNPKCNNNPTVAANASKSSYTYTTSLFKLSLLNSSQSFNQIAIGYTAGATNGFDNQIDAVPFVLNNTMVSSLINNVDYIIQGRALPFANTDVVALGFRTDVAGSYSFSTEAFEGVFVGSQAIFIRDNLLGIVHNIKQSPYNFIAAVGIFNTRFEIVYQPDSNNTICYNTTIWNGSEWTNNTPPTLTSKAIFAGNFTATSDLSACAIEVIGSSIVNVPSGFDFTVVNEVNVAATASLVFENNANLLQISNANNIGNIVSKRNTAMQRLAYTFWSSPVLSQNVQAFSPLTLSNRFYTYNEATNTFLNLSTPSTAVLAPANGYSIRAPNTFVAAPTTAFVGSFSGVPNNGNFRYLGTKVLGGYNLIGNPYPSTLSVSAFFASNPDIDVLYYWNNTVLNPVNNGDNYATQNRISSTRAVSDGKVPTDFIAVGQGFFAKLTATSSINFYNTMRSSENNPVFFRNATTDKSLFKLNLLGANTTFNQIAIGYVAGATNGVDNQIDAVPFASGASMLSSLINNSDYVIQGRVLPFSTSDVVPLGFKTDVAGSYSFTSEAFEGVFANNQNIYLKDNFAGITHNIKQSAYQFTSNIGTFNNRFEIVYQSTLGIENPNFDANNVFVFVKNNNININSGMTSMKNIQVFDIHGRLLFEKKEVNASAFEIENLTVQKAVMFVKITLEDGQIITKKTIL